jgi:hypothetical protein
MKTKPNKPSSVRLTPRTSQWIANYMRLTGLPMSSLINHAIEVAAATFQGDRDRIQGLITDVITLTKLREIERDAEQQKAALTAKNGRAK